MINKKRLVRLTRQLLRINSENPPGDERAVARFVASYLRRAGLASRILRYYPRRDNVIAVLPGRSKRYSVLLSPHLDTVPAGKGWKHGPFSGATVSGRIYGRGATDCKGNLAVAMEALHSLKEDGAVLRGDWVFLATADEETGSGKGLVPWLERCRRKPDYALILDSDEFNIITAQKGLIHFKVRVPGRKAHGAYPSRGVNAIDRAVVLISALKKIKLPFRRHALLKPPTVNIGTICGGDKVNMVADWCEFEVDLRFLPGMAAPAILEQVRETFRGTGVPFRLEIHDIQQPYEIATDHPLVRALRAAAKGVVASSPVRGSEGATVITFFKRKGIPAVATGWGAGGCAHATDEFVRVADMYRGARILERFIKTFDTGFSSGPGR
ncbi:MAG: M20 family metallopeptidase [Candidatus Omnitrophica bacterium]|nr:M20 family metallopeptidase [Candidatus Omnitrophota bacterium]MDD5574113.1 M20 family metallopeptidase [Candidatus Omnitrophota bacterium]